MSERLPIILLLGKARSGKDTAGKWIAEHAGGTTLAFADKLKSICQEMFELSREDCYTEEGKQRETKFLRPMGHAHGIGWGNWTVRQILQHMGTEAFRAVDPDVWVKYALREARRTLSTRWSASVPSRAGAPVYGVVAITDGRFKSEVAGVRAVGGEVWRIRRPGTGALAGGIAGHVSEEEQDSISDSECDVVIENDGSIELFRERVLAALAGWRGRRP